MLLSCKVTVLYSIQLLYYTGTVLYLYYDKARDTRSNIALGLRAIFVRISI